MKHQIRLLTARRSNRGQKMRIRIHNCFTDRSEELVYLRGRLYDGIDPTIDRVAVMFEGDEVVQIAKGVDVGLAAVLAFILKAWNSDGVRVCCL